MIDAVCFNRHVFQTETLERILKGLGVETLSPLFREGPVNCIESFRNGNVCYSYSDDGIAEKTGVFNCKEDIDMFIYVNTYNNGKVTR